MAVPHRASALVAKTTLVAVLAGAIGVSRGFAAWGISLLVLPDAALALSGIDQWRQVAGVGLVYLLAAVIAVAVGILVRSTAAAVSIVLVWSLMAEQLLQVIPGFGETIRPYLPFSAAKDFLTAEGPATGGSAERRSMGIARLLRSGCGRAAGCVDADRSPPGCLTGKPQQGERGGRASGPATVRRV